jgi:DnaK suppressor protein
MATKAKVKIKKKNASVSTKEMQEHKPVRQPRVSKESKESLEQFKKVLLDRREQLAASVKSHAMELPETGLDGSAGDSSDHAAADFTTEMFGALLERQAGTLEEVEHALQKIKSGEFGICEMCDVAIASKRLKALPWAKYCLECQTKADRIGAIKRQIAEDTEWAETSDERD